VESKRFDILKTESRIVVTRACEEGMEGDREMLLNGCTVLQVGGRDASVLLHSRVNLLNENV
jgi:hypothetical protein